MLCLPQRAEDTMTTMYDVIVVGAGVEGLGTAYNLAKANYKTLVIEQFNLPHSRGSSHGQSRIIRKAYYQTHYANMMFEAYKMWDELAKAENTQLQIRTGLLVAARAPSADVQKSIAALTKINAVHHRLNTDELRKRYPMMQFKEEFEGVFDPDGGALLADRTLKALLSQFLKFGGTVRDGEPVTSITPGDTVTITTSRGKYQSKSVVICAGPWTTKLVGPLGLHLPLKPVRIGVYYWRQLTGQYTPEHNFPTLIFSNGDHIYAIPALEYPNHVKVCYHSGPDIDPDARDDNTGDSEAKVVDTLRRFIQSHLPGVEDRPSIVESCIYTNTPDEDFILDTHPHWKNIVVGAGFSGHGFKLAPVVGKLLSELATGGRPSYDMTPFKIDRFFNKPKL